MRNKTTGNSGENGNKKSEEKLPMCMALGMCFGTLIGVLTKNIGLWLPMGLCFGIIVGSLFKGEQ